MQRVGARCSHLYSRWPSSESLSRLAERAARAAQLAAEEAKQPFDLAHGPLWRVKVFRDHDEAHLIVLVMHHIVSDAWSFYVFCQELAEFYEATVSGRPASLAESADPVRRLRPAGSASGFQARFSKSTWPTGGRI